MSQVRSVLHLVAVAVIAASAASTFATESTEHHRAATAPILIVNENTRAESPGLKIGDSGPQRVPALTVFAAAQPRPLSPRRSAGMPVSGRVYSAESGKEAIVLAELPWSLDAQTGRMTSAIGIGVRNAVAIRAGLRVESNNAPLELRFVGSVDDSELVLDQPTTIWPGEDVDVWSTTLTGPVIVVELARLNSEEISSSAVLRVLHIVEVFDIGRPGSSTSAQKNGRSESLKTAGDCFVDAVCETASEYQSLAAAVAYLDVTRADGAYQCSGALINDTSDSGRARVLTAAHCVEGALSITAYFKFRSTACNGPSPSLLSLPRVGASATTIWNDSLDYGLIVYDEQAPAGTMLLGWDTSPLVVGDELVDIHHAGGGTQSLLWSRVAVLRDVFIAGGQVFSLPRYESQYSDVGSRGGSSGSTFVGRNPQGAWGIIRGVLSFGAVEADQATCPSDGTKFSLTAHGAEFGQIYPGIQSELETPPPPIVSLSASPTDIIAGSSATLTWSSTNATACTASGGWVGARATSGSETTGALAATTAFTLTCEGAGGTGSDTILVTVSIGPVTVPNVVNLTQAAATAAITGAGLVVGTVTPQSSATVPSGIVISQSPTSGTSVASGSAVSLVVSTGPAQTAPPEVSLSASPASIAVGGSSTLTWSSTNATACTASGGWAGARATSGTASTGALFATTGFTLTCTGPGGIGSSAVTVSVTAPTPPPTVSLVANPASIAAGASSTLTWSSTNATACTASGGWAGARATSGTASTGALFATTGFTLTCAGPGGTGASAVTVTVTSTVIDNGPTNLDRITGLEWLDLSQTAGQSYSTILGGAGSWLANGWRYATVDEIATLWAHMGITYREAPQADYGELAAVNRFFEVFGLLGRDFNLGLKSSQGWTDPTGTGVGSPTTANAAAIASWNDQLTSADVSNLQASSTYASTDIGSYLVRSAAAQPAPTVSLVANPASIAAGASSTLTWSSTNATACAMSGGWSGTGAASGSATTGTLSVTTAFTITCSGPGGAGSQSVTVIVTSPPKKSGGGGAVDFALLAMLLGAGIGFRRRT